MIDFCFSQISDESLQAPLRRVRRYAGSSCQSTNSAHYRLTITFVLCINYDYLQLYEREHIYTKVTDFMSIPRNRIYMYRAPITSQANVYNHIQSPPGLVCTNKEKLKDGLADPGGWRSAYNDNQTSIDVHYTCAQEQTVQNMVHKIENEVLQNNLHSQIGFHVIAWALHQWYCPFVLTTSKPET